MLNTLLAALWFFLPAGIGNAAPIFAARLPGLRKLAAPIDFGCTWRGKRILGDHKTWRGLLAGILASTLTLWLLQWLAGIWSPINAAIPGYTSLPFLTLGPLLGLGALTGDATESFFKRQRGTPPGKSWFPFDQIDYILGAIVFSLPVIILPWQIYLLAVVLWPCIHLISTYVGYRLRVKDAAI